MLSQAVKDIQKNLPKKYNVNVDIIFVQNSEITRLNKEYRKINEPTDVLSFNIDEDINEVYLSPSYIFKSYKGEAFFTEIVRNIIHGILHICGYDHKGKFVTLTSDSEDMFKLQEKILDKVLKKS